MKRILTSTASAGLILCQLVFVQPVIAADTGMSDKLKFECSEDTTDNSVYFAEIQAAARRINQEICSQITSKIPDGENALQAVARRLPEFGELVSQTLKEKIQPGTFPNLYLQLDFFLQRLGTPSGSLNGLPSLENPRSQIIGQVRESFFFGNQQDKAIKINAQNNDNCRQLAPSAPSCAVYFKDLAEAINPYQLNANAFNVYKTRVQLSGLSQDWDRYFEVGRYQNGLGIALTSILERDHFDQDFLVGPPSRQWLALQPGLVLEDVQEALDGDNLEYAVSIEWIGINWWQDSLLGVPFGLSLVSVYADRAEVADVGHGLLFYFDNKYAVGITDHDGDEGIFVTLDLLKLLMDKQEQLESYRDDVRKQIKF